MWENREVLVHEGTLETLCFAPGARFQTRAFLYGVFNAKMNHEMAMKLPNKKARVWKRAP
jgi:hypothetical protein